MTAPGETIYEGAAAWGLRFGCGDFPGVGVDVGVGLGRLGDLGDGLSRGTLTAVEAGHGRRSVDCCICDSRIQVAGNRRVICPKYPPNRESKGLDRGLPLPVTRFEPPSASIPKR